MKCYAMEKEKNAEYRDFKERPLIPNNKKIQNKIDFT